MIYLGEFKANEIVPYALAFHNDQGNVEDPTSPSANIRSPNGTWSALPTPSKQNNKTGLFGGEIDTTGYFVGLYIVEVSGTVSTAKTVRAVFTFRIVENVESDIKAIVDFIKDKTDTLVNPDNDTITNIYNKLNIEIQPILEEVNVDVFTIKNQTEQIKVKLEEVNVDVFTIKNQTEQIKVKTDTLGTAHVTVLSPISNDGKIIDIVRLSDYYNSESRAIEFTNNDSWPDLTGATVKFKIGTTFEKEAEVVIPSGDNKKVRVELSNEEINSLTSSSYKFVLQATLLNQHIIVLTYGTIKINNIL